MTVKKGDFIEIEYTGRTKEDNHVFDTTSELTAKANTIHSPKTKYGPIIICIGEHDILPGLDANLDGKEVGKSYNIELPPEKAFGKKDAKLVQLIPTNKFRQSNINPFVGLQVNVDGAMGTIKTLGGGRSLVDFNHPLSGRVVVYEIKINKLVTDKKEQLTGVLELLGPKPKEVTITEKKATIKMGKKLHPQMEALLKSKVKKVLDLEAEFSQ